MIPFEKWLESIRARPHVDRVRAAHAAAICAVAATKTWKGLDKRRVGFVVASVGEWLQNPGAETAMACRSANGTLEEIWNDATEHDPNPSNPLYQSVVYAGWTVKEPDLPYNAHHAIAGAAKIAGPATVRRAVEAALAPPAKRVAKKPKRAAPKK